MTVARLRPAQPRIFEADCQSAIVDFLVSCLNRWEARIQIEDHPSPRFNRPLEAFKKRMGCVFLLFS